VTIGRNHTSKVVLRDISVSRSHCSVVFKQGRLYIQDKKSKFGTLVRTSRGVQFDSQFGLQLQFQSKIVEISQAEFFNGCCLAESNSYVVEIGQAIHQPAL
jgi:pSer/pThr/pTyr-binding forkhead associated (FHA) protein